ncbi:MAG: YceI family protein [Actinobacteria bacterium]|nr:YceI family protein [Actinomycetota bacterium]
MSSLNDLKGTYVIDGAHSRIGFSARHAMVTKVRGGFGQFEGTAVLNAENPAASKVEVTIQADSFDSGVPSRDDHVKSADFLDVEKYPTLTFTSTDVKITGPDTFDLTGDLTIKDKTHPITIPFTYIGTAKDPFGNVRAGFEGETTINRKDYGIVWNAALETGGVLVSEKVTLDIEISAIQQQ